MSPAALDATDLLIEVDGVQCPLCFDAEHEREAKRPSVALPCIYIKNIKS